MGLIDSILASDAAAFVDPDLMPGVEAVTYYPRSSALGTGITMNAQVFREGPRPVDGLNSSFSRPSLRVFIAAGMGISSIDTGGDRVSVAEKLGGVPKLLPVVEIINQGAGGWTLKLI